MRTHLKLQVLLIFAFKYLHLDKKHPGWVNPELSYTQGDKQLNCNGWLKLQHEKATKHSDHANTLPCCANESIVRVDDPACCPSISATFPGFSCVGPAMHLFWPMI